MKANTSSRQVAVLGASPKKDRYSNMAVSRLLEAGYTVLPVNPAYNEIEGLLCVANVSDAALMAGEDGLDTLSLYLAPGHSEPLADEIVQANPRRVVFNPGTESSVLKKALDKAGLKWLDACTLVLLATNQF